MVAAVIIASSGCSLESARMPDGSRRFDKPYRIQWYFAQAQASRDFGCPVSRLSSPSSFRSRAPQFRGCGQSGSYTCERRERRAPEDIEQELDHVWEVYYVCRRLSR